MDNRNRKLLHGMILEWQQPIYNLAYRMLGNEADAADATQDIFTRVIAGIDRFDAERERARDDSVPTTNRRWGMPF